MAGTICEIFATEVETLGEDRPHKRAKLHHESKTKWTTLIADTPETVAEEPSFDDGGPTQALIEVAPEDGRRTKEPQTSPMKSSPSTMQELHPEKFSKDSREDQICLGMVSQHVRVGFSEGLGQTFC
jgi:hypothetical protein